MLVRVQRKNWARVLKSQSGYMASCFTPVIYMHVYWFSCITCIMLKENVYTCITFCIYTHLIQYNMCTYLYYTCSSTLVVHMCSTCVKHVYFIMFMCWHIYYKCVNYMCSILIHHMYYTCISHVIHMWHIC